MKLFPQYDAKKFAAEVKFFGNAKRAELVERFWAFVANCIALCLEHGNSDHINKAAQAAEVCGYGPTFRRVITKVTPFKFDRKAMRFTGKIMAGKRKSLLEFAQPGKGIPTDTRVWEVLLKQALAGKDATAEPAAFDADKLAKRAKSLMTQCHDAGLSRAAVNTAVSQALIAIYGPAVQVKVEDKRANKKNRPQSVRLVERVNKQQERARVEQDPAKDKLAPAPVAVTA